MISLSLRKSPQVPFPSFFSPVLPEAAMGDGEQHRGMSDRAHGSHQLHSDLPLDWKNSGQSFQAGQ